MKTIYPIIFTVFFIVTLLLTLPGCEYDVAEPLWEQPYTEPPIPKITQVNPAQALAGVNVITITGENFADLPDSNTIYFDGVIADVISNSATTIVVRRPALVSDSATIKLVSSKALVVAKYKPYKIDNVLEQYGSFLENEQLSVIAVDHNENLYVVSAVSREVIKVNPTGEKSVFSNANRTATDAKIGPDGNLYLLGNNRAVDQVNLTTGQITRWTQLPSGKAVRYGDFDSNGFFYAGGTKTDLVIVEPSLTVKPASGFYANDEIHSVKAFGNYIYVASRISATQDPLKVWRHTIEASGNIGPQELVIDLSTYPEIANRMIKSLSFSADGIMYLATDSENPLLTYNQQTSTLDYLYKNILPSYCKHFFWGTGNYLYLITGDTAFSEDWTVYRVDTGVQGAH